MTHEHIEDAMLSIEDLQSPLAEAMSRFDSAKSGHYSALEIIAQSEQRMKEIQAGAESMQLELVLATADAAKVRDEIQHHLDVEERSRAAWQEAVDILEAAKLMVEETKAELDQVQQARIAAEMRAPASYIKEIAANLNYQKHLTIAELEAATSRLALNIAERDLAESKISVANAHLNILESPDVLDHWPKIQSSLGYEGEGMRCLN